MRVWRPNIHSLRDLFCLVLLVTSISVLLTYQLSRYLPPRQHAQLNIQFRGRVDFYPNPERGAELGAAAGGERGGPEGMDLDDRLAHHSRSHALRGQAQPHGRRELLQKVVDKIRQIEAQLTSHGEKGHGRVAVLDGDAATLTQDLPVYQYALKKAGFKMDVAPPITNLSETVTEGLSASVVEGAGEQTSPGSGLKPGWWLYLCLTQGPTPVASCPHLSASTSLKLFQKMNRIPDLDDVLTKQNFCSLMSSTSYIPSVHASHLSPPCFVLPRQWEEFLGVADAMDTSAKWVVKPMEGHAKLQLLQPTLERDFHKLKLLHSQRALVQQYIDQPLLLFGMPFSVTVYILVTSLTPLRAYIHSQGIVQYRHDYQRNFQKVPGRTWSLEHWHSHLAQTYTLKTADTALKNMDSVITQTLLISEFASGANSKHFHRCYNCYQLLAFELLFNSSFHPLIVEVSSHPDVQETVRPDNWASWISRSTVVEDTIGMVTANVSVATDVIKALGELNLDVDISTGGTCQSSSHSTCLLQGDIEYLLSLRREMLHKSAFRQLYPSPDSGRFMVLLSELHKYFRLHQSSHDATHPAGQSASQSSSSSPAGVAGAYSESHMTSQLHPLLVGVARYFHTMDSIDQSYDDLNIPISADSKSEKSVDKHMALVENIFHNSSAANGKEDRQPCTEDKWSLPYLRSFHTEPALNVTPRFNVTVTDYYATVPYEVFLLKVWAFAENCFSEARLEEKYGLSRPSNYTLGLGSNELHIVVVDVTHTEPWVINRYTITVYRQSPGDPAAVRGSLDPAAPHLQVCSLLQDCDLPYMSGEPCGLQQHPGYSSWAQYHQHRALLPACQQGDSLGEWLVLCTKCSSRTSCDWSSAVWQPVHCQHPIMSRDQLKQCLARKQILFIGDSTNRGVMHYLMEQVNDSLTEWDKTHNSKVYSSLNSDSTTVTFAYYPQFWLPANQRPVFDKALYQLMKQTMPLENNHNTVLVVGGVHWLATHHIQVIVNALLREGLSNIKVVVKSLGAGFHQPVDGLHCLTLREQRKLLLHNAGLVDFAKQKGFDVVDTFNMTMARYKDFLQGKCACHFHRVKEVLPSFTEYMKSTGHNGGSPLTDMPIHYHVEGDINAVYSEILLNRICEQPR